MPTLSFSSDDVLPDAVHAPARLERFEAAVAKAEIDSTPDARFREHVKVVPLRSAR